MNSSAPATPLPHAPLLRARYAIGVARRGALPGLLLLAIAGWVLTGIVIVQPDELGIYERFGSLSQTPLEPGLNVSLPFPFGRVRRVPVYRQFVVPVGFRGEWNARPEEGLLWTSSHGAEEFPLLAGTTTELVVINALLTYQIKNTPDGLREYHVKMKAPEQMLFTLAEQMLSQQCNSATLDAMLSSDKCLLSEQLRQRLQTQADDAHLGLMIVSFGIVSVHPPVEVAAAYLDVMSAKIDAERLLQDAKINARSELTRVEMTGNSQVADAKAAFSARLTKANAETAVILALAEAYSKHPAGLQQRLFCQEMGQLLRDKEIILVDADLPKEAHLWLDDSRVQGDEQREKQKE